MPRSHAVEQSGGFHELHRGPRVALGVVAGCDRTLHQMVNTAAASAFHSTVANLPCPLLGREKRRLI